MTVVHRKVTKEWIWQCIYSYLWKLSTEGNSVIMFSQTDKEVIRWNALL